MAASNRPPRSFLPVAPLIDAALAGRLRWDNHLQTGMKNADIAAELGITTNVLADWLASGRVPLEKADAAAIHANSHPLLVWPDYNIVEAIHVLKVCEHRKQVETKRRRTEKRKQARRADKRAAERAAKDARDKANAALRRQQNQRDQRRRRLRLIKGGRAA